MSRRANTNVRDILSICNSPLHSAPAVQKMFPNKVQTIACCHWTKFIVFDKSSTPIEITFEICKSYHVICKSKLIKSYHTITNKTDLSTNGYYLILRHS